MFDEDSKFMPHFVFSDKEHFEVVLPKLIRFIQLLSMDVKRDEMGGLEMLHIFELVVVHILSNIKDQVGEDKNGEFSGGTGEVALNYIKVDFMNYAMAVMKILDIDTSCLNELKSNIDQTYDRVLEASRKTKH